MGRDFLPRGSGIVTRRPTIVQMIQTKPDKPKGEQEEVDKNVEKKGNKQQDETAKEGTVSCFCLQSGCLLIVVLLEIW